MKFWSQYLQHLQSYLEIFMRHLAAAEPLLETNNISPVCRHIMEICPVLMTCTEKIAFCLQHSGTKYTKMKYLVDISVDISFGPNGAPLGAR